MASAVDFSLAGAPDPAARFKLAAGRGTAAPSERHAAVTPSTGDKAAKPWHPDSPLLWFAGIAAVAFGLMAFSTTVRVGRATGTVSIGTAKG